MSVPFYVPTVVAGSNNNRPASTAFVTSAVATLNSNLSPYVSDTPPSSGITTPLWFNSVDGQLYIWYVASSTWIAANSFTGGNGYVLTNNGTLTNPTISVATITGAAISSSGIGTTTIVSSSFSGGTIATSNIDSSPIGATTPSTIVATTIGATSVTAASVNATSSVTTAAIVATSFNGGQIAGMRNRLINGDFRIDQRYEGGATALSATGATYVVDRWFVGSTVASKLSFQRQSTSSGPGGLSTYMTLVGTAAYNPGSTDVFNFGHRIEGINTSDFAWGSASPKTVTLSFWAVATATGTYSIGISNTTATHSYVVNYTITTTGTWQYFSITIPGPTVGTWNTLPGTASLLIRFDLGSGLNSITSANAWTAGSYTRTSTSASIVTANTTLNIAGVQLETGTVATPYEMIPYPLQLALCQRYYEKSYNIGILPGATVNSSLGGSFAYITGLASSTNNLGVPVTFNVNKMAIPTITMYSTSTGASGKARDNNNTSDVTPTSSLIGSHGFNWYASPSASGTGINMVAAWTAESEL